MGEQADTIQSQLDAINDLKDDLKEAKRSNDKLREQAVTLRKTNAAKDGTISSTSTGSNNSTLRKYEEKIKVLEAQVKAYKSELARMEASAAKKSSRGSNNKSKVSGPSMSQTAPASRAAWEAQKRLRKRAD